jgi:hypothetical protein
LPWGSEENNKKFNQDGQCTGQDLNEAPAEHTPRELPIDQPSKVSEAHEVNR